VLRRPETRVADDERHLAPLTAPQADLAEAVALAREFADLVRTRQPDRLDGWLTRAATTTLSAVQRFAQGLCDDDAAVKAGGTLPWSHGPVEGHITRLNMLKRQGFGRARLDLLSRRLQLAPRQAQAHVQRLQEPASPLALSAAASPSTP
jgi:transposase